MYARRHMRCRVIINTILLAAAIAAQGVIGASQTPTATDGERDLGVKLYKEGRIPEAISALRNAVKKNKDDSAAWYYSGLALLRQKDFKKASKAFETSISIRPELAGAHVGLAFTLLLRNKLKDAKLEAQKTLALEPNNSEAHYILGVVALREGSKKEALEHAETAIRLDDKLPGPYLLKSQALVHFDGVDDVLFLTPDESSGEQVIRYGQAADSLENYLQLAPESSEKQTWSEQLDSLRFYIAAHTKEGKRNYRLYLGSEVTTKARLISKPEPTYTEGARNGQVSGTVVLKAVFASDATVKHIIVVRALPEGLTAKAIAAARSIRFVPATLNGQSVSMWMQLEYNFSLY